MPENYFSGRAAERYDELHAPMFELDAVDPAVDFLADLAGKGSALELGIGTGRIALPLAQRGVQVHGVLGPHRMWPDSRGPTAMSFAVVSSLYPTHPINRTQRRAS